MPNKHRSVTKNQSDKSLSRHEEEEIYTLLEFAWSKIQEKHRNVSTAFRFLDYKGKGKLRKSDFAAGLEKMKILLSRPDCDRIFNHLDKLGTGRLTFNQFCNIVEETQSHNVDVYKIQEIEEAINEKIKRENI